MASKITVGKIVATATDKGWSQAYHAGGFTAVIAVTPRNPGEDDKALLQTAGKKLLDTLVSEYFTLTTKDLKTIQDSVKATVEKAPNEVETSLIVAACIKNVLYVVIANEGRVLLKRGEKIGSLLEVTTQSSEKITSVSGFLESNDVVLLHTTGFMRVFTHDDMVGAFQERSAEELAEYFAPRVHESQNGTASALVFSFHEDEPAPLAEEKPLPEKKEPEQNLPGFDQPLPTEKPKDGFSHRQRLFLSITVILALVLIGSVGVFLYRGQQAKQHAQFIAVYAPAKTKYDEAQGLLQLNKALAIQDLQQAQQQLQSAKNTFSQGSSEEQQLAALLSQVTESLTNAQKIPLLTATSAPSTADPLLTFASNHLNTYVSSDDTNFYTTDSNSITSYNKKTNASKKLITADWKSLGGFQTYLGNMYVVDKTDGILKYVAAGSGFGNASKYFTIAPDLSKVVSMAIDGSVWLLGSDESITKYTKGTQDSFAVSGLDTPLSSPTQIITTVDMSNVYILDKGNERVVVLKKDGSFVAQYASDTVRTASMMDISETDKKIYLLSQGTIYQIDMK